MRLIDADSLQRYVRNNPNYDYEQVELICDLIDNMPTVKVRGEEQWAET